MYVFELKSVPLEIEQPIKIDISEQVGTHYKF